MQSRQVTFYVDTATLAPMMVAIRDRVIPRYEALPHFLGLTAIKHDGLTQAEVIVTSFWDDGVAGSTDAAARFIDEIVTLTGRNPIRKTFDTLFAQVRTSSGAFGVTGMEWEGRPRRSGGSS
jgi:hypothetical protein